VSTHAPKTGSLVAAAPHLDAAQVGDPFDPTIHEAVMHDESNEVNEPTCTTVMRPGYKHNDRLLRPAMVGVSDPAGEPDVQATEPEAESADADSE